jgi:putative transposase
MAQTFTQLFVHFVWCTWDRRPLLNEMLKPEVYAEIQAACVELGVEVLALGGVDDHVHLLVQMPASLSPAALVKQVKGASSHAVNHVNGRHALFRWQGGYGAFTVTKGHVPRVRDYVLRQEEHHRLGRIAPDLEPAPFPAPQQGRRRAGR